MLYEFSLYILILCISTPQTSSSEVPDLTPLLPYLSEQAYFSLTNDTGLKEGENAEKALRQLSAYFENWFGKPRHYYRQGLAISACYTINIGYRNSMRHLLDYFNKRFLYVNNLEYEIGYLCHQIIAKYQIMIELYHIVKKRFVMNKDKEITSPNLMLYLYTNILGQEKYITHLCNMLQELEKKYEGQRPGWFDDYIVRTPQSNTTVKIRVTERPDFGGSIQNYLSYYEKEQKRKRKERKKQRQQDLAIGRFALTTPRRRPKKSRWALDYGWSIENW